jgi:hypothetical protein
MYVYSFLNITAFIHISRNVLVIIWINFSSVWKLWSDSVHVAPPCWCFFSYFDDCIFVFASKQNDHRHVICYKHIDSDIDKNNDNELHQLSRCLEWVRQTTNQIHKSWSLHQFCLLIWHDINCGGVCLEIIEIYRISFYKPDQ